MKDDDLTIVRDSDGDFGLRDSSGQVWWPADDAQEEIRASADPEETVRRICREQPMRGDWHC